MSIFRSLFVSACTLIASKLLEITPPTADDFVYITDRTYTRNEVLEMEATVCNALRFNFNFITPYQFVDRFLRASYASSECSTSSSLPRGCTMDNYTINSRIDGATNALMKKLVFYILDLAVLEYKLVRKKPSLVTAAAVYLGRATLGIHEPATSCSSLSFELSSIPGNLQTLQSPSCQRALKGFWSKTLEYYTGYDIWDLEESVRLLHHLQENAEDCTLSSTFNKHKSIKCKMVALKTAVNVDELGFLSR